MYIYIHSEFYGIFFHFNYICLVHFDFIHSKVGCVNPNGPKAALTVASLAMI